MKKRRSSSISSELQIWTPKKTREPSSSRTRTMDLSSVPSSKDSSSFTLPEDWVVEKRKRTGGFLKGNVDLYYHEPGTGKKLRSLISVKRYLTEPGKYEITSSGDIKPKMDPIDAIPLSNSALPSSKHQSLMKSLSSKSNDSIVAGWRTCIPNHQIEIDRSKPFKLPNGWFIRRIPRFSGQSIGRVDKYYCERATGLVFRSKLAVQRYLAENYLEENTTLSELFKQTGLIKMSRTKDKDANEETTMAIVPHRSNMDSYSSMFEDVPLKDLIRKSHDLPLKDLLGNYDDLPLKDQVRKSDDLSVNDFDRNSDEVPLTDHVVTSEDTQLKESDNVPLKDRVLKSYVASKTSKNISKPSSPKKNVPSSTTKTNTTSIDVSNQPIKIKWVLSGTGGDGWSPFMSNRKVAESVKQEWSETFTNIVSQKQLESSVSNVQD